VDAVENVGNCDDGDGLLNGLNYAEGKPVSVADEGRVEERSNRRRFVDEGADVEGFACKRIDDANASELWKSPFSWFKRHPRP
jgi:hypothetical protein